MVDSETGLAKNDSVRTSSGFFYELGEDEVRAIDGVRTTERAREPRWILESCSFQTVANRGGTRAGVGKVCRCRP